MAKYMKSANTLMKQCVAEGLGTGLLVACVVGSGIMGERLSGGNAALALLANTLATGAILVVLILTFGPISGAHFNPVVTVCGALVGEVPWIKVLPFTLVQVAGGFAGTALANAMFGLPVFFASHHVRTGGGQWLSEFTATFGLLAVIWGVARRRQTMVPFAVGAYITAAYWFTSSTSFANPAVTLARTASDTFAGIRPADSPAFMVVQYLGAISATLLFKWLAPASGPEETVPAPVQTNRSVAA